MTASNGSNEGHGASVRRVEDPPFLRGTRPYTDDLREPGALYAVFVRSGFAHAKILGIDSSEARRAAGRGRRLHRGRPQPRAVRHGRPAGRHAGRDAPAGAGHRQGALHRRARRGRWSPRRAPRRSTRPSWSTSTTTRSTCVVDMTKALDDDAPKLFEMGNLAAAGPTGEDALADAEVRTGARFINQRIAAVPMEPGAALAEPDPETGGFILYTPSQGPHAYQGAISTADGDRGGEAARRLDRDRRRLRRAHRVLPGADRRRRARPRARQGRALHRDALGDDARDAARPRAGAGRRDRRHARRQDHRPEGPRDRRLRRLSRPTRR